MQLHDFFDYKNKLMEDLLTSEEIVRLTNPDLPFEDSLQLAYSQIFPYEHLPKTAEEGKTYICFDVDIQQSYDKTFYEPIMHIWVFAHDSQLRLPEGGVRIDKICAEICELINGSRKYSLGELNIFSVRRFTPMTGYLGKCITFRMKEFNKFHDPNKYIPANRKKL